MAAKINRVELNAHNNKIDFTGNIPSTEMNSRVKSVTITAVYPSTNVYKCDCKNTEILYTGKRA